MYRKKMFWMAFAVGGLSVAAIVHAQNNDESSGSRTLADRFKELRESFSGRRPSPEVGGRTAEDGDTNANNARRPSRRFGRPASIVRRGEDSFREPTVTAGESTAAPLREKPTTTSPFGRRPTTFRPLNDGFDASSAGSSRRRTDLKRIESDSTLADTKPDRKEPVSGKTEPKIAAQRDHEVFTPAGSDAFGPNNDQTADATPAIATPESPIRSSAIDTSPKVTKPVISDEDLLASDLLIATESPALSVRTAGPRKIVLGRESLFEVRLKNAAQTEADGVVVSVDLPDWAEVTGTEASSGTTHPPQAGANARPLEWHVGRLSGGTRETLRLKIIPRKSIPFELGVRWTFTPKGSHAKVEVQEPKLTMRIAGADEVRYGQTETYRLIVGNPGTGDAENVVVHLLPNGPGDEAVASVEIGTISAGDEIVREIAVTPREQGELHVRAEAVAADGLSAKVDQQVLIRRASVTIEAAGPKIRYSGTDATFTVQVTNTGNYTAQNVMVKAKLPSGATYVRDTAAGSLDKTSQELTWRVTSLPAGSTKKMQVVCQLSQPGVNQISITASGSDDIQEQTTASTRVDALADLRMSVVDPQGPVPTSEQATYQIRIQNRGNKAAENVDLVVFFSTGLEPVAAEGATHKIAPGQVTFNRIASIAAGGERVIKIRAKAKQGGSHILRAELVCSELETKLAVEETTRFYDEDAHASRSANSTGLSRQASAASLRSVPFEK